MLNRSKGLTIRLCNLMTFSSVWRSKELLRLHIRDAHTILSEHSWGLSCNQLLLNKFTVMLSFPDSRYAINNLEAIAEADFRCGNCHRLNALEALEHRHKSGPLSRPPCSNCSQDDAPARIQWSISIGMGVNEAVIGYGNCSIAWILALTLGACVL